MAQTALVNALGVLLLTSASAYALHFDVKPPAGRAAGGDRVQLVFESPLTRNNRAIGIRFGNQEAKILSRTTTTIDVETPTYQDGGDPDPAAGGFRQRVVVMHANGAKSEGTFTYLNENAVPQTPAREPAAELPGSNRLWMTVDPPVGTDDGEQIVVLRLDGQAGPCDRPRVWFGAAPAPSANVAEAGTITTTSPRIALPARQWILPVRVRLQCAGGAIATGNFLYLRSAPESQSNSAVLGVLVVGFILIAFVFSWRFRKLEKRLEATVRRTAPSPTTNGTADLRTAEKPDREGKRGQSRLRDTTSHDGATSRTDPFADTADKASDDESFDAIVTDGDRVGEHEHEIAQPRTEGEETSRVDAARARQRPRSQVGVGVLTEIWNEVNARREDSQQFIRTVQAAWPKSDLRVAAGLIVITIRDAELAWVVPTPNPILHKATIQEFFETRDSGAGRGGVTLIRPATIPKGVDIQGYTAGQITRGLLEK
jgi:hypothetical protein